jgi:hypothetical protein
MVSPSSTHEPPAETNRGGEALHRAWDLALFEGDAAALTAMYAPDAVLESPLVSYLMEVDRPLHGHDEIRPYFERVAASKPPPVRRHSRIRHRTEGGKLIWEYPRETPVGEQLDSVEVMELDANGLIKNHRVYWGWFAIGLLLRGEPHA